MIVSINNLDAVTEQQVFDHIVAHLRKQNQKAVATNGSCKYRLGDLKCAAGCLIPEDRYVSTIEGKLWMTAINILNAPATHFSLINALQSIHDDWETEYWEEKFEMIATRYNLDYAAQNG